MTKLSRKWFAIQQEVKEASKKSSDDFVTWIPTAARGNKA